MKAAVNTWLECHFRKRVLRRAVATFVLSRQHSAFSRWCEHAAMSRTKLFRLRAAFLSMLQQSTRAALNTWSRRAQAHAAGRRRLRAAFLAFCGDGLRKAYNSWAARANELRTMHDAAVALMLREERDAFTTWHENATKAATNNAVRLRAAMAMVNATMRAALNSWIEMARARGSTEAVMAAALRVLMPEGREARAAFNTWGETHSRNRLMRRAIAAIVLSGLRSVFVAWSANALSARNEDRRVDSIAYSAIMAMLHNSVRFSFNSWFDHARAHAVSQRLIRSSVAALLMSTAKKAFNKWTRASKHLKAKSDAWLSTVDARWFKRAFVSITSIGDCLAMSAASDKLISAGLDGRIPVYSLSTGEITHTLQHSGDVRAVAIHGNVAASAGVDGWICIWSMKTGSFMRSWQASSKSIYGLGLQNDMLVSAGADRQMRLWSARSQKLLGTMSEHSKTIWGVSFTSNVVVSASADTKAIVSSVNNPAKGDTKGQIRILATLSHPSCVYSASAEGTTLATGCMDGCIYLWSLQSNRNLRVLIHGNSRVCSVRMSGETLISSGENGKVKVWEVSGKSRCCGTLQHGAAVLGLALSDKGDIASVGRQNGGLRVWRLPEPSAETEADMMADDECTGSEASLSITSEQRAQWEAEN